MDLVYNSFARTGADRMLWRMDAGRLRILCYHGLCEDAFNKEPWVPSYFVSCSAFARQLEFLRRNAVVLPLFEAVTLLRTGSLPPRSVSITFDDGYANNLHLAHPMLRAYEVPATIFLASAYIESGELYPFLRLKLIRLLGQVAPTLPDYKANPLDVVMRAAAPSWPEVAARLPREQYEALRPLYVEEVRPADRSLIEFGAHGHTHCILGNETPERRREEIRTSVAKVHEWTGAAVRVFSYPNGERGDFGESDKETLRETGVKVAVTGMAGANSRNFDPLALRRYPLTMHHGDAAFRAEVSGFRSGLRAVVARMTG